MRPAFAGHAFASAALGLTLLIWWLTEIRRALHRRPGATDLDRGSLWLVRGCAAAAAVLAALALNVPAADFAFTWPVFALSLLLVWAGVALRWWCFHTLGRYFTFSVQASPDQRVIGTGPYAVLRHPSYLAIMLILAGIGASYGNWLSLGALTIIPLFGFVVRIRVEEAALTAMLGSGYTSFARTRKRLLPFVW